MTASTESEVGLAVMENFHGDSLLVERFCRVEACKVTDFGIVAILYFIERPAGSSFRRKRTTKAGEMLEGHNEPQA
jgi:hypothetical protein